MKNRVRKRLMQLQDVVRVVGELSRNDRETSLVVADLLNRGVVRVRRGNRTYRTIAR